MKKNKTIYRVYRSKETPLEGSINYYDTNNEKEAIKIVFLLNNLSCVHTGEDWVYAKINE